MVYFDFLYCVHRSKSLMLTNGPDQSPKIAPSRGEISTSSNTNTSKYMVPWAGRVSYVT